MKNLAAAAKALSRTGPKQSFEVTMGFLMEVQASNEEEARELAEAKYKGKRANGSPILIINIDKA